MDDGSVNQRYYYHYYLQNKNIITLQEWPWYMEFTFVILHVISSKIIIFFLFPLCHYCLGFLLNNSSLCLPHMTTNLKLIKHQHCQWQKKVTSNHESCNEYSFQFLLFHRIFHRKNNNSRINNTMRKLEWFIFQFNIERFTVIISGVCVCNPDSLHVCLVYVKKRKKKKIKRSAKTHIIFLLFHGIIAFAKKTNDKTFVFIRNRIFYMENWQTNYWIDRIKWHTHILYTPF